MFEIRKILNKNDTVLASQSPRRKELMRFICDDYRVVPSDCDEILPENIGVEKAAEYLAELKCSDIANKNPHSIVIGCDTVVILGDTILGKPADDKDAYRMLSMLSGNTHKVISGVAVYFNHKYYTFSEETKVTFKNISDDDIYAYIATSEPRDKAGAYGIQGYGSVLINGIQGDYFNVVGLPVSHLADCLARLAY